MTDRTRVRRLPHHQVEDRARLDAVLDAGRVAHIAIVDGDLPLAVPFAYGRDGDRLLVHGSTASRAVRRLADGAPASCTVTLVDGVVVARAAFEVSMHYRSAMVMGRFTAITDLDERAAAIAVISEHVLPGRWAEMRPPPRKELAATAVLALPIREWSLKVHEGWPDDSPEDRELPIWAGILPYRTITGPPVPEPGLAPEIALPPSLRPAEQGSISP
jgi:nitroimidazol reductase NimA-like FMN-containing flavoprotein (pyridoxamine 5'-phosphate oxidase superfamily)